jgi:hypothetical protein
MGMATPCRALILRPSTSGCILASCRPFACLGGCLAFLRHLRGNLRVSIQVQRGRLPWRLCRSAYDSLRVNQRLLISLNGGLRWIWRAVIRSSQGEGLIAREFLRTPFFGFPSGQALPMCTCYRSSSLRHDRCDRNSFLSRTHLDRLL